MTKGIIFASHPHKGPAFHTFLKSFLRPSIFHAAQEEKIEPLVEMNNYFISTVNDINILSFWETDGKHNQNRYDARMGARNETAVSLMGTEQLWAIQSKADNSYAMVAFETKKLIAKVLSRHHDEAPPPYQRPGNVLRGGAPRPPVQQAPLQGGLPPQLQQRRRRGSGWLPKIVFTWKP